jgi:hypothetical protein
VLEQWMGWQLREAKAKFSALVQTVTEAGGRCHAKVCRWFATVRTRAIYLSVLGSAR